MKSNPRRSPDLVFKILTGTAMLLILAILAVIVGNIVIHGYGTVTFEFLTSEPLEGMTEGGIFPAIFGTVALVILMIVAVIPIGVMTAIYLQEYANPNSIFTKSIRFAVNNLAGVPSIVFGLFGLGFFIQFVGRNMDRAIGADVLWGQPSLIWAALTLALLNLPVVVVSAEEALRVVPREHREASLALGGTKWQTIRRVILPQALPGILTGAILSISRGAGEVAPIMFTGAAYYLPYLPTSPTDQFMELGYHIYVMSTQSPDVEATKPILYGTVLVLLILTLLLNFVAILIRYRMRIKMKQVA
ncbi:MAG: phosphate ABC transporter, permease protein PstA [candidate division Zixibacteria bacterium RBG_16_50_21]|nr:MAG: phosphate ABC transporter, permease protein PstA [candidate division Zixibacteria bacterium RBG_16_50_21]